MTDIKIRRMYNIYEKIITKTCQFVKFFEREDRCKVRIGKILKFITISSIEDETCNFCKAQS